MSVYEDEGVTLLKIVVAGAVVIIAVVLLVKVFAGVEEKPTPPPVERVFGDGVGGGIQRFYDPKYGVACYQRWSGGALSCVRVTP